MSNETVAKRSLTDSIPVTEIIRVALAEGEKRNWCDELKDVLRNGLGIEIPERPNNLAVRFTIEIPAEAMDYASGKKFWSTYDPTNPAAVALKDDNDEPYYGVNRAKYAAASALRVLTDRAVDSYYSGYQEARATLNAAKIELIELPAQGEDA